MTTASTPIKRCSKCGKDVTGDKRLKDGKGHYWCMDCGATDPAAKNAGLMSPCPKCHAPVHAAHLVRHNGIYVCENCAAGVKVKRGSSSAGTTSVSAPLSEEDAAKRKKMILGVVLIACGGVVYYVMNTLVG